MNSKVCNFVTKSEHDSCFTEIFSWTVIIKWWNFLILFSSSQYIRFCNLFPYHLPWSKVVLSKCSYFPNPQLHLCSVVGIMLNIYIVLLASVLVVIASLFLQYDATLSYSIVGCLIFVSTTAMLGILFVPKVSAFVIFEMSIVRQPATAVQMWWFGFGNSAGKFTQ